MAKRTRKPIVRENLRNEWLRRHDAGENLAEIAKKDGFDIRTVRRQVESAETERELTEARRSVLREALKEHFNDFVILAKSMHDQVEKGEVLNLDDKQQQLLDGLRHHLPRSPIFAYRKKWDAAVGEELVAKDALKKRLRTVQGTATDLAGVAERLATQMASELLTPQKQGRSGPRRSSAVSGLMFQPAAPGTLDVVRGSRSMGEILAASEEKLRALVSAMERDIKGWEEFKRLGKLLAADERLKKKLQVELRTLQLKSVVPGRCPYCPV